MSRNKEVFVKGVFYPVAKVAEKLSVDKKTIYNAIGAGHLTHHRLYKRTYRVEGSDLNAWLSASRGGEPR